MQQSRPAVLPPPSQPAELKAAKTPIKSVMPFFPFDYKGDEMKITGDEDFDGNIEAGLQLVVELFDFWNLAIRAEFAVCAEEFKGLDKERFKEMGGFAAKATLGSIASQFYEKYFQHVHELQTGEWWSKREQFIVIELLNYAFGNARKESAKMLGKALEEEKAALDENIQHIKSESIFSQWFSPEKSKTAAAQATAKVQKAKAARIAHATFLNYVSSQMLSFLQESKLAQEKLGADEWKKYQEMLASELKENKDLGAATFPSAFVTQKKELDSRKKEIKNLLPALFGRMDAQKQKWESCGLYPYLRASLLVNAAAILLEVNTLVDEALNGVIVKLKKFARTDSPLTVFQGKLKQELAKIAEVMLWQEQVYAAKMLPSDDADLVLVFFDELKDGLSEYPEKLSRPFELVASRWTQFDDVRQLFITHAMRSDARAGFKEEPPQMVTPEWLQQYTQRFQEKMGGKKFPSKCWHFLESMPSDMTPEGLSAYRRDFIKKYGKDAAKTAAEKIVYKDGNPVKSENLAKVLTDNDEVREQIKKGIKVFFQEFYEFSAFEFQILQKRKKPLDAEAVMRRVKECEVYLKDKIVSLGGEDKSRASKSSRVKPDEKSVHPYIELQKEYRLLKGKNPGLKEKITEEPGEKEEAFPFLLEIAHEKMTGVDALSGVRMLVAEINLLNDVYKAPTDKKSWLALLEHAKNSGNPAFDEFFRTLLVFPPLKAALNKLQAEQAMETRQLEPKERMRSMISRYLFEEKWASSFVFEFAAAECVLPESNLIVRPASLNKQLFSLMQNVNGWLDMLGVKRAELAPEVRDILDADKFVELQHRDLLEVLRILMTMPGELKSYMKNRGQLDACYRLCDDIKKYYYLVAFHQVYHQPENFENWRALFEVNFFASRDALPMLEFLNKMTHRFFSDDAELLKECCWMHAKCRKKCVKATKISSQADIDRLLVKYGQDPREVKASIRADFQPASGNEEGARSSWWKRRGEMLEIERSAYREADMKALANDSDVAQARRDDVDKMEHEIKVAEERRLLLLEAFYESGEASEVKQDSLQHRLLSEMLSSRTDAERRKFAYEKAAREKELVNRFRRMINAREAAAQSDTSDASTEEKAPTNSWLKRMGTMIS